MNNVKLATESDFQGWRRQIHPLLEHHVPFNEINFIISPPEKLYEDSSEQIPLKSSSTFILMLPQKFARLIVAVFSSGVPERFKLIYQLLEQIRDQKNFKNENDSLLARLIAISHGAKKEALLLRNKLCSLPLNKKIVLHLNLATALLDSQAQALLALRPDNWLIKTNDRILCASHNRIFFAPSPQDASLYEDDALFDFAKTHGIAADKSSLWRSIIPFPVNPAPEFILKIPSLSLLKAYAADCQLCPLCKPASRTVTGEGHDKARLMFVGEQPGDQEDIQGRPFVGPAGQLFDRALEECHIEREKSWITNAVKHFRFTPYGNGRRLHQKPEAEHIKACSPWLQRERELLKPKVTIMMGVTGGTAILGRPITVSRERSKILTLQDGSIGLVTVHPSFLLRQPDENSRAREYAHFVADLKLAYAALS